MAGKLSAYDSSFARLHVFVAAATVGAHAGGSEGFRQRDVKFLSELFMNWEEHSVNPPHGEIRAVQVLRWLDFLLREGYARKTTRGSRPRYLLTRTGLLELIGVIAGDRDGGEKPRPHVLFTFFFLKAYRSRLIELVEREGREFPFALKIELTELLDISRLLKDEVRVIKREILKLDERIDSAFRTAQLVRQRLKAGTPLEAVVLEAQRAFPYELNSQKPLSELIGSIPEQVREWELSEGNESRARYLWEPEREMLKSLLRQLEKLATAQK